MEIRWGMLGNVKNGSFPLISRSAGKLLVIGQG